MSISVDYNSSLTTVEALGTSANHQTGNLTASGLNSSLAYQATTSTPPCTSRGGTDIAMTGGAVTLDLTALVGSGGVTVDGSGKRVQYIKVLNPATNHTIAIATGASNGYDGFGVAFKETLYPGGEFLKKLSALGTHGTVISGSNKTLDITGTGTEALSYEIVLG
jgi:hypothetical protein